MISSLESYRTSNHHSVFVYRRNLFFPFCSSLPFSVYGACAFTARVMKYGHWLGYKHDREYAGGILFEDDNPGTFAPKVINRGG